MTTRTLDTGARIDDAKWYVATEDAIRGPFRTKGIADQCGAGPTERIAPGWYAGDDRDVLKGAYIDNDETREVY